MLALVTSFLGTTLGFSEFLVAEVRDISAGAATRTRLQLPRPVQAWWLRSGLRGTAFAAALAPPMLIAAAQPDIFLDATLAAGAYGNALLYGVVPPLMVHALRRGGLTGSTRPGPFAALGLPVRGLPAQGLLASTAGASGFIVLRQAWSDTEGLLGTTQEPQGVLAEASTGLVSAVVNSLPVGAPPWPWQ